MSRVASLFTVGCTPTSACTTQISSSVFNAQGRHTDSNTGSKPVGGGGGKPISSDIFLNAHTAPVEGFLLTTPEGGKV